MARPNPGGQQKQLSPVVKLVLEHNPDDLAKWRESCGVSEEVFDDLANKRRDQVTNLMRSGQKAFSLAAQTLISLVQADPDAGLSADILASLQTDVFSKTAEAITKAETEKAEATAAKKKADLVKQQAEDRKKTTGEVHNIGDFLGRTLGKNARAERLARFTAFSKLLTPAQRQAFAEGLKEGDQTTKFEALTQCAVAAEAVVIAQANNWI